MHEKYFVNPENILKHNLAFNLKRWRSEMKY